MILGRYNIQISDPSEYIGFFRRGKDEYSKINITDVKLLKLKNPLYYIFMLVKNLGIFNGQYDDYIDSLSPVENGGVNGMSQIYRRLNHFTIKHLNFYCEEMWKFNENIIFVDFDLIFFRGNIDTLGIDIPYEVYELDLFWTDKHNWIYSMDKNLKYRRYRIDNQMNEFRKELRKVSINKILN